MATFSEGPNSPTTAVNVAGPDRNWVNPSNVLTSNDIRATAVLNFPEATDQLRATNFGFSIPVNASIVGVVVEIERRSVTGLFNITTKAVQLVKSSSPIGATRGPGAGWPVGDTLESFGSSSDGWGASLTPADVNDTTFGLQFAAEISSFSASAEVDHVRMTVYYSIVTQFSGVILALG